MKKHSTVVTRVLMAGTSHLLSPPGGFGSVTRISAQPHSLAHSHLPNCCVFFSTNSLNLLRSKSRVDFYGPRKVETIKIRAMAASFGSRLEETVRSTITENPVVVYSKTWCSYSSEVKSLFKKLGVVPFVIELDALGPQGPQLQKVLERLTGQHTVPNVFIGGKHIGGCTDTVKLHRKGELETLLLEASARKAES